MLAGTAMARRAGYMFAPALERGPRGQVDAGIGKTTSSGSITLIPPTHSVTHTGEEGEIDGVRFYFQLVPDSEAPAEMNFGFPDLGVLCVAENAVHCMRNVLTPRGAPVRDSLRWSKYLGEAIELFGAQTDVMFAQHHWPRWGKARVIEHLARHRDMYRYLHDQTLRLANRGLTPTEIAAEVRLPPSLERTWSCRGYYGTVSHNVRAVYQRYLGFFDGNPAHLDPHPPVQAGQRYVDLAGGIEALLASARKAFAEGDYRWVAELCSHAVFANPQCSQASELQAQALEQLGYQAESAGGATCIWSAHTSCAPVRRPRQAAATWQAPTWPRPCPWSSCGMPWACASTDPGRGTPRSCWLGISPTWASGGPCRSRTAR